jgi:hypothetical protein
MEPGMEEMHFSANAILTKTLPPDAHAEDMTNQLGPWSMEVTISL